ncbi:16S rRNA (adenine(1518)-N(6)/adenine(1519)-N(6))-dimethyltransferase RsmA, partial [Nocardia tengchongensis]|uniref:16S rRNA (adenine(1518)-N(6)/adenine(1519)-N(6))- dimethyltransferase RsmA n=1 Tax=Nocardia tengchongensis TaxID=2055889 RepID=UPI0036CE2490
MSEPEVAGRGKAALLGPAEVRELAERFGVRPTKQLGQNFVHDANTMRRIVATAGVSRDDTVLEVGPGLGSLTLALLDVVERVVAVEIDPTLATNLPQTVAARAPELADRLTVVPMDAMKVTHADFPAEPTALVANLPYNVAVPVLLHLLAEFPSIRTTLIMVQLEVADRLAATPGGRIYGVPSVKAGFYGNVRRAGTVGRQIFWPVPQVESGLVRIDRFDEAPWPQDEAFRQRVFAVVDAAWAPPGQTRRPAPAGGGGGAGPGANRAT